MPKKMPANQRVERHSLCGQLDTRKMPGDYPVQARNIYLGAVHGDLAAPVHTGHPLTSGDWEVERQGQVSVYRSLVGTGIHQRGVAKRCNPGDGIPGLVGIVETDPDLQRRSLANEVRREVRKPALNRRQRE